MNSSNVLGFLIGSFLLGIFSYLVWVFIIWLVFLTFSITGYNMWLVALVVMITVSVLKSIFGRKDA